MGNPFKTEKGASTVSPLLRSVNAKNFFGKEEGGFDDKPEFLSWGEIARDEDVAHVGKFIRVAQAGYKFIQVSLPKRDKGGVPYKFLTYLLPNADSDGIKLVLNGPWEKVFEAYQNRLIKIDFTLDELIEEARK